MADILTARKLPFSLEAEQSVLGAMMLSKDAIADVIEALAPNDFYRPAHQAIYDCILDLYGRGEPAEHGGGVGRVGHQQDVVRTVQVDDEVVDDAAVVVSS